MRKTFFAITFVVVLCSAFAQPSEGIRLGAGIRLGLPIGDFEEFTSFGVGAELQGEYTFSDIISGVGTIGYTSFLGKDYGAGKTKATGYIPILVGVRGYPASRVFIGAQIGYGILTSGGSSEGSFNYQPQFGYNASKFQVTLNYNGLLKEGTTFSHLALIGIFKFGGN